MKNVFRLVVIVAVGVAVAITAAGISLTLFLNGSGLRQRVEATLTKSLGRQVTIGRLELSLWTGSLLAEQMTIADDPHFGTLPFVAAARVRMGVAVLPLLLTRQVRLDRFAFEQPVVRLTRAADGSWNYSSLGGARARGAGQQPGLASRFSADLAVSSIRVDDAIVSLKLASATEPAETRVYDHIDVGVEDFGLDHAFPFRVAARLPQGGSIRIKGSAGPFVRTSLASTPLTAQVEAHHVDLEPAGLVTATGGVAGLLEQVTFDLTWTGDTFHVGTLTIVSPRFAVTHRAKPPQPPGTAKESVWSRLLDHLVVDRVQARVAALTLTGLGPGAANGPRIYRDLDVQLLAGFAAGRLTHFGVSARLPGNGFLRTGGAFTLAPTQPDGVRGPLTFGCSATVQHLDLAASGFLPPRSPISGVADAELQLGAGGDGTVLGGTGSVRVARLKLARNGQPSVRPVTAGFAFHQREAPGGAGTSGTIDRAEVSLGGPVLQVAGSYLTGRPSTSLKLQVRGEALPIDGLEAFLPVVGVELPEGSRLAGGTLTLALAVAGEPPSLDIQGPVRLENTRLAGFDLGAKLASLAKFTGGRIGSATVSGTGIKSLALDLHVGDGLVRTDHLAFDVAGVGPGTGSGTIGPGGTLSYKVSLKLTELVSGPDGGSGLARDLAAQLPRSWQSFARGAIDYLATGPMKSGIPILIGGTTKHPTFTPNLGALLPAERPRR